MQETELEGLLTLGCAVLTEEARHPGFETSSAFEQRVRRVLAEMLPKESGIVVDLAPPAQAFPDIALGDYGVEVKFTLGDAWRSVANSVQETQRVDAVKCIYIVC